MLNISSFVSFSKSLLMGALLIAAAPQGFAETQEKKIFVPQRAIAYEVVQGEEMQKYLGEMIRFRLELFRESPYFYEGTEDGEREYLNQYLRSDEGVFIVAKAGTEVLGLISGIPMRELEESSRLFLKNNISIDSIFYLGEVVVDPRYQGSPIEIALYRELEDHVRSLSGYNQIAECIPVLTEENSTGYLFEELGAVKHPALIDCFFWKEIGKEGTVPHFMQYWIKPL
ncbi:MAG: GNAT family N-acetyltransferase [Chlamydiota bacterium]